MKVEYRTKKLKKQCEDPRLAQKDFGVEIGNRLTKRIRELMAATTLMDIKNLPSARLHRLEGKRAGQYAVDLVHPHRLVLKPILDEGENIENLKGITIVMIEEVTDYHGKKKR